ncbi:MAG: RHS repeat domain-containing protein [Peptostreptococcaceae bacterium]|nr:RHS repeat domain-containing protein [Peptostreptococcaceae bacterium]
MKKIGIYLIVSIVLWNGTYVSSAEEYQYDEHDRLVKVIYDDGSYIEYVYDMTGNIITELHRKKSENTGGTSGGGSPGNNSGGNSPIEPSYPIREEDPKVGISTSKHNDGHNISAKIETKSTDTRITTSIEIEKNEIQNVIKNKKDLFIDYDGVTIRIKNSQLKHTDKNKSLNITISRDKKTSLEQIQGSLKKSKKKVKRIEYEFNIRIESRKQIEFESIYIPKEPNDIENYRIFEIKGKEVKIKNARKTQDGSIRIKGKSSNRVIGIFVLENI